MSGPGKRVLAIWYSQTGQLTEIMRQVASALSVGECTVDMVEYQPVDAYAFPWTSKRFFEAMPECVLTVPSAIRPLALPNNQYDLILVGYQPWFLSPSIPITSLLHDPEFRNVARDTPVVTIIGARNMWLNAQDKVRRMLKEAGAHLVGNVALVDRHVNPVSAVTILYWMFSGKKDRFLNVFPVPGVTPEDIAGSERFGRIIADHLRANDWEGLQPALAAAGAVEVKTNLMFIESRAGKIFSVWARIIRGSRHRSTLLVVFKYYLMFALFLLAPVIVLLYNILFRPFLGGAIRRKKQYYAGV